MLSDAASGIHPGPTMIFFLDRDWWAWNGWPAVATMLTGIAALGALGTLWFFWLQLKGISEQARKDFELAHTPLVSIVVNSALSASSTPGAVLIVFSIRIKHDVGDRGTLLAVALTAAATAVLAWKTWNLATATESMAKAALAEAKTTGRSGDLQAQELEAVKTQAKLNEEQVELARSEFQAAQEAAWPELDADVRFTDWQNVAAKATVDYIHGLQPAYAVQVIVRRADRVLCGGRLPGALAPPTRLHDELLFGPLTDGTKWPARIRPEQLTERNYQFAVNLDQDRPNARLQLLGRSCQRSARLGQRVA